MPISMYDTHIPHIRCKVLQVYIEFAPKKPHASSSNASDVDVHRRVRPCVIISSAFLEGSRPLSQSPSPLPRRPSPSAKRDAAYVVQAGRLISQALLYERDGEFEEAFDLLKAGVDLLLNGVQSEREGGGEGGSDGRREGGREGLLHFLLCVADSNKDRREVVRQKTSEYLLHAENLQAHKLSLDKAPQVCL